MEVVLVREIRGRPGAKDSVPTRQELRQSALPSAVPVVRGMVAGFLAGLDVPATRSGDIQLAVTEACANVVRHAYPDGRGDVLCQCEATDEAIVIRVSDWGLGTEEPSAQPGLGLGIPLIERLSDRLTQRRTDGVTLVEMCFDRRNRRQ